MTAFDLLSDKIAYNQWANQVLIDWLKQQPDALYEKEVMSSFSSINKLMHHIIEAEKYYLSILSQTPTEYEKHMTTQAIFEELKRIDQELVSWQDVQSEEDMERIISLKRSPFVEKYTVATLITHVVNHSTYHRGQVIALRHQLEMTKAPRIDYYRYFIAQAKMD
ncbi:MAG: DinB family protein [Saprospiraceae bacterium]|nr:DinB family protein [Saprospiraceae bacterium]